MGIGEAHFHFFGEGWLTTDYKSFISSCLLIALMGFVAELLRFLKWYISVRKRVTTNCMQTLLKDYKAISDVETDAEKNKVRMDH